MAPFASGCHFRHASIVAFGRVRPDETIDIYVVILFYLHLWINNVDFAVLHPKPAYRHVFDRPKSGDFADFHRVSSLKLQSFVGR
jgi:hypothetical protein